MNYRILELSGALLISATLWEMALAQGPQKDGVVPPADITRAVETFAQLVSKQTLPNLGFQNAEQLKSLKPGRTFKKYLIGLNDLRRYQAGQNVENLIKDLPAAELALVDGAGAIQSAIEFEKGADGWRATGFGLTPDLKTVAAAQAALPENALRDGRLIRIPALHTAFLAVSTGTVLNFVILEDNPELDFRKGATLPAADVLLKLTNAANLYNGLPQ